MQTRMFVFVALALLLQACALLRGAKRACACCCTATCAAIEPTTFTPRRYVARRAIPTRCPLARSIRGVMPLARRCALGIRDPSDDHVAIGLGLRLLVFHAHVRGRSPSALLVDGIWWVLSILGSMRP